MDDKEAKFARDVLHKFATSKDSRLQYGAKVRSEMQKALANGGKIVGYRAEWLYTSADSVLNCLIESSEQFNNTYSHDMISVQDLKDVLNTVLAKLDSYSKG